MVICDVRVVIFAMAISTVAMAVFALFFGFRLNCYDIIEFFTKRCAESLKLCMPCSIRVTLIFCVRVVIFAMAKFTVAAAIFTVFFVI